MFPFTAVLCQLDTAGIAEDPDGSGPLETGYDVDFREPVLVLDPTVSDPAGDLKGTVLRKETLLEIQCQVETEAFEAQRQVLGGTSPDSSFRLVIHFKELEERGLIDERGQAKIRPNDRLDLIRDRYGNIVHQFANPPGMFVVEALPGGYGLGRRRNLLIVTFEERERGVQSTAR
jgi:hypothetical protein